MCNNPTLNDDNVSFEDYDVQIEAEYFNHDYDVVDIDNQLESEIPQTDILFE